MKNKSCRLLVHLFTLATVGFFYSLQAIAAGYTITDLGAGGYANGVNANGEMVGTFYSPGPPSAFLYSSGVMTNIGSLVPNPTTSSGEGINTNGQVIVNDGAYQVTPYRAFVYSNGTMTNLGSLGGVDTFANGINDSGQVVGYSHLPYLPPESLGSDHAFLYDNGVMTDLGTLGGVHSTAYDINNLGDVIGESTLAGDSVSHLFLYKNGTMTDLGIEGPYSYGLPGAALRINDLGQVARGSMLYSNGVITDIGTLGGASTNARGLNNNGVVVGSSAIAGNTASHAFLYSNGAMTDLNTLLPSGSGWLLNVAYDISDSGHIVGSGVVNGQRHAYLMTPVPLPAATWLFGSGLAGLIGFARRRKK